MFMFCIISSDTSNKPIGSPIGNFSLLFLFVLANRGSVDGIVWFMLHDFSFLRAVSAPVLLDGLASTSEGDEAMEVGLKEYTPVDGEDDDEEEDEDEVEREGEFDELSHKPENGN